MDILELFPFMRRAPEPETPADTLPVITERLNGGSGDPVQVSHAVEQLLDARTRWTVHRQSMEVHLQKLAADGADERKRRPVRDAIARASEEINLLEIGEAPLKQRLVKAKAEARLARQYRDHELLAATFKEITEGLLPLADRAGEFFKRAERGELDIDPRVGGMVFPLLKFFSGWVAERRPDFETAVAILDRQPPHRAQHPDSRPVGLPRKAPVPEPRSELQHTVGAGRADNVLPELGTPRRPRAPDDMSPLEAGEVRVTVIRAGYETPDGKQCDAGQVIKLPAYIAQKAIGNSAVAPIEMNIDRTVVQGADWQGADPRGSLTFMGSGGTSITQHPDKPAEQPNEGTATK